MGDVGQFPGFDLAVALGNPGLKAGVIQLGVAPQGPADGVDDKVEEVGLIAKIAVRAGKDHPVGAARCDHPGAGLFEAPEEPAPGTTAARGPAPALARVHGVVIQGFDQGVQVRVDGRLEAGDSVKIEGKVEEPAGSQARQEAGQGGGEVDEVQDGMGDEEVPGRFSRLPVEEIEEVGGFKRYPDFLGRGREAPWPRRAPRSETAWRAAA